MIHRRDSRREGQSDRVGRRWLLQARTAAMGTWWACPASSSFTVECGRLQEYRSPDSHAAFQEADEELTMRVTPSIFVPEVAGV